MTFPLPVSLIFCLSFSLSHQLFFPYSIFSLPISHSCSLYAFLSFSIKLILSFCFSPYLSVYVFLSITFFLSVFPFPYYIFLSFSKSLSYLPRSQFSFHLPPPLFSTFFPSSCVSVSPILEQKQILHNKSTRDIMSIHRKILFPKSLVYFIHPPTFLSYLYLFRHERNRQQFN